MKDMTAEKINEIMQDCTLCPRRCHADRTKGGNGFCRQGAEVTAARAALHFWEEPCISGSCGSGTVFFSGCNVSSARIMTSPWEKEDKLSPFPA